MVDRRPPVSADLGDQLLAVHARLDELGVPHAFGGAIALAYHVRQPRGTADLDVNLAIDEPDTARVLAGLGDLAASTDHDRATLVATGFVRLFLAGHVPLDLFVPQHEFHADLQAHAEPAPFRSAEIPIVSATHLTVLKAMFDRSKDWADIEGMLEAGSVDEPEALRWLAELLGEDHGSYRRLRSLVRSA